MNSISNDFLAECKDLSFGSINLSENELLFYDDLNKQLLKLCESLPDALKNNAILFLFEYSNCTIGGPMDFFKYFYPPVWSILYWINNSDLCTRKLTDDEQVNIIQAHSMTLFLHSLDDHLHDGDLRVSHLLLHLRTQAWLFLNDALESFTGKINGALELVKSQINNYFNGIMPLSKPETLDDYCGLFKDQISTWLITPKLLINMLIQNDDFLKDMQKSFESFAVAWRLIDDINDIEQDLLDGEHTSVYHLLPDEGKKIWDSPFQNFPYNREPETIFYEISNILIENMIIEKIREIICIELNNAAEIADQYNIKGLSDQYNDLVKPLMARLHK